MNHFLLQLFRFLGLVVAAVTSIFSIIHRPWTITVTAKIIDFKQYVDTEGDTISRPVYCIDGGTYDGKTWTSHYTSNTVLETIGGVFACTYNPKTGAIHNKETQSADRGFAIFVLVGGFGCLYALINYDI